MQQKQQYSNTLATFNSKTCYYNYPISRPYMLIFILNLAFGDIFVLLKYKNPTASGGYAPTSCIWILLSVNWWIGSLAWSNPNDTSQCYLHKFCYYKYMARFKTRLWGRCCLLLGNLSLLSSHSTRHNYSRDVNSTVMYLYTTYWYSTLAALWKKHTFCLWFFPCKINTVDTHICT